LEDPSPEELTNWRERTHHRLPLTISLPTRGHGRIVLVEQDQRVAVVKPQHAIVPYASRKNVADQLIG